MEPPRADAIGEQMQAHLPILSALARRLTAGNASEAADLVQDTVERALRQGHLFQPGSNLRAWLCTIMRHLFIDRIRSRTPIDPNPEPLVDESVRAEEPIVAPEPVWTRVTAAQLDQALARLEPEFRAVYDLVAAGTLTYVEIGERLGIPRGTVSTRMVRARAKLREILAPELGRAEEQDP
jgi:RNA polymerase sigma-70 factor (ECF subfamily)